MNRSFLLLTILSLSCLTLTAQSTAYVANFLGNSVSVVDLSTSTVTTTIDVGIAPFSSVVNPTNNKVYVANRGSNSVSVIDAMTNTVETTISVGTQPQAMALSPDGTRLYVPNKFSSSLSVINTTDNSIVTTIDIGGEPYATAVSPDGSTVLVTSQTDETVQIIDAMTNMITDTVEFNARVAGVTINPAGTKAYVSNGTPDAGTVGVIDLSTNTLTNTITVGSVPIGLQIGGANDSKLYVCNRFSNNISVIDLTTEMVETTIAVGSDPLGIDISGDGTTLYVANFSTNALNIIDVATNMSTGSITVGSGPWSLGDFVLDTTLPGEQCNIAIDINNLFGQAEMMPQLSDEYDNTEYSTDASDPDDVNCELEFTKTIWFAFTGDGNRYTIKSTNEGMNVDLTAHLYTGDCTNLTQIACNDDDPVGGTLNFGLDIQTEEGVDYILIIDEITGDAGNFTIEVTNQGTVSVQDISNTAFNIYPNPTNGWVNLNGFTADHIEVFDQFGRRVQTQVQAGDGVDLTGLPAGVYVLRMQAGDQMYSAKVVKE